MERWKEVQKYVRKGRKYRWAKGDKGNWMDWSFLVIDTAEVVDRHCTATDELSSVIVYPQSSSTWPMYLKKTSNKHVEGLVYFMKRQSASSKMPNPHVTTLNMVKQYSTIHGWRYFDVHLHAWEATSPSLGCDFLIGGLVFFCFVFCFNCVF